MMDKSKPTIPNEQQPKGPAQPQAPEKAPKHPTGAEELREERGPGEARGDNIEQNTRNQGFRQTK